MEVVQILIWLAGAALYVVAIGALIGVAVRAIDAILSRPASRREGRR